jgi:hypothetical protein
MEVRHHLGHPDTIVVIIITLAPHMKIIARIVVITVVIVI